jgi:hypothetical protein
LCFVFFLNNNKKLKFTFTSSRVVSLRVTQRKKEAIIMYNRQVILVEVKIIYREENVEGKLFCCFFFHVFESFIYVDYTRWTELREKKNYKLISLSQLHFGWTITIMTIIPSSSHEAFVFFLWMEWAWGWSCWWDRKRMNKRVLQRVLRSSLFSQPWGNGNER